MSRKHLLALLNSHLEGDEDQFFSIALQIAAQEARQGRADEADTLKRLVQKARDRQRAGRAPSGQTPIPLARPRGELQELMESGYPREVVVVAHISTDPAKIQNGFWRGNNLLRFIWQNNVGIIRCRR